ncbi:hypothetical protein O4215_20210 [Rhodococcus maanshanensis]|uniref:hypothetical protein n=1 Tax=Rhodococcus maanshanensis TaxID=183556 RepID=UPI0022B4037C|nr:hypothetical protein [Rhodococcus maanshanensis]MCZ4557892.1 hypothetical protein [Rhodococcus maanshanensis]
MGMWRVLAGLLAVALLSGCGATDDAAAEESAAPVTQASASALTKPTCLAENLLNYIDNGVTVPEPTTIPTDFVPTAAITCEGDWGAGVTDHAVSWLEEHRQGNLDAVLAGFALPSEQDGTCFTDQPAPPVVWLIDDRGLGMRPVVPTGRCGGFKWDAITAIDALPLGERIVHKVPVSPEVEARFAQ